MLDAETILETLIETMNLTDIARQEPNDISQQEAISKIEAFLLDPEDEFSEVIYVPGGAGVVRISLQRQTQGLKAQSVDFTPKGAPSEFHIPFDKS